MDGFPTTSIKQIINLQPTITEKKKNNTCHQPCTTFCIFSQHRTTFYIFSLLLVYTCPDDFPISFLGSGVLVGDQHLRWSLQEQSCRRTQITGWFCPAAWSSLMSFSYWSSITHILLLLLLIQLHLTSSVIFLREARITTTFSGRLCRFLVKLEDFYRLK